MPRSLIALCRLAVLSLLVLPLSLHAQDGYQMPPDNLKKLADVPPTPRVSVSPTQSHMLLMEQASLPPIEELAQTELRLAGIRINPRTNGPSRVRLAYTGLALHNMDGSNERAISGIPYGTKISDVRWAPDGQHIAFIVTSTDRLDLYVASVETATATRMLDAAVNDAYGSPFSWAPDGQSLVVRTIPAGRGAVPEPPLAPSSPIIQENTGEEAPARTYQDLLQNPHDEAVFKHYITAQLMRVGIDGTTTAIGSPSLIRSFSTSPDGNYLLTQSINEPFSYLVPAYRFGNTINVLDKDGNLVHTVAELPLAEQVPTGFGSVPTGIRSIAWRADTPATLYWAEALDGGDARAEVEYRDAVYMLEAPFSGDAVELTKLPLRYGGIMWGKDDFAIAMDAWWKTRTRRMYIINPEKPGSERDVLFDLSYEDRYSDPGSPAMMQNEYGRYVLEFADRGRALYLTGQGASPEGNRPFLRKLNLKSRETEELFRSEAPYYERVMGFVDSQKMHLLTLRESESEPANYFIRDLKKGTMQQVTQFEHPYPELASIQKEFITYTREDGVQLSATLYLPPNYDKENDGPLPTFLWAYPREFKSANAAGQVTSSPYQFKRVSYWGAVPYVTQGYAILDNASMPIIGEGDSEPNDSFVKQLVMNAQAAIDEGVRRGVVDPNRVAIGGHSYGAFMTANLLAHSDLFRAGVARSGAYNRTLTPFGFQAEERTFWEAPEIYFAMSPFMHADKVDEPILLIHGEADNNSGTFPIQSKRFYNALKGHGHTARLVMLPHESHGYRAYESIMHMLWETNTWLDTHVKNAPEQEEGVPVRQPSGR